MRGEGLLEISALLVQGPVEPGQIGAARDALVQAGQHGRVLAQQVVFLNAIAEQPAAQGIQAGSGDVWTQQLKQRPGGDCVAGLKPQDRSTTPDLEPVVLRMCALTPERVNGKEATITGCLKQSARGQFPVEHDIRSGCRFRCDQRPTSREPAGGVNQEIHLLKLREILQLLVELFTRERNSMHQKPMLVVSWKRGVVV